MLPTSKHLEPIPLAKVIAKLELIAPLAMAENWDNVGLLAGDREMQIDRIMTCLTISPDTAQEAIDRQAQLVVAHHPMPFKPIRRIVTSTSIGRSLWSLIRAGIAIYSPHTAWDNAAQGINAQLASILELTDVHPVREWDVVDSNGEPLGVGRIGTLEPAKSIRTIVNQIRSRIPNLKVTANLPSESRMQRLAIVCGSGGSFVETARHAGADLLVTGEATYHQCLEAQSMGLGMLMIGHFDSERFAMDTLASVLKTEFPTLEVWSSNNERDPVIPIE
ncbi:MAG: Nif3-like dinuclear metal center hexameric protein [Pirellulaceae bacterium]|nr:Nif3-like dinuclear metal center hexameric protein [Pirellulaceae bacterium]